LSSVLGGEEVTLTLSWRAVAAAIILLQTSIARAQMLAERGPPQHRIVHKNTFAIRYNPLGLLYDGRFSYRYRLYESTSKALRDNFIGVGIAPTASPAFLRIGPYVEFHPASVFGVWAAVQFVQYFGTFDLVQGFAGAQSNFSDSAIRENTSRRLATNGVEFTLGATTQFKISSVLIRSQARLVNGNLRLRDGDRIYYDQFYDVAVPNGGWFVTNDLDVLYQGLENKLVAGARYTFTAPFYDRTRHFDPAAPVTDADNVMHRVGPFFGYTFKISDGAKFNNPTLFVLVQWWLKHRFRTGADTSAALPLIGIGFQMTGDFLPLE
jgi:hypothetical protein